MLDFLLAAQNMPFVIAISVALLIGVFELIALTVGMGGLTDGLTGDADISADGFSFLDYLCIGRIPFLMWLIIALMTFGVTGIIFQSILDLNAWIATPIVLLLALFPIRSISLIVAKVMPKDETTAIHSDEFIGGVATVVLGEARRGYPTQAKYTDIHKQTHYLMVEPFEDGLTLSQGDDIVLYEKQGNIFLAYKNS